MRAQAARQGPPISALGACGLAFRANLETAIQGNGASCQFTLGRRKGVTIFALKPHEVVVDGVRERLLHRVRRRSAPGRRPCLSAVLSHADDRCLYGLGCFLRPPRTRGRRQGRYGPLRGLAGAVRTDRGPDGRRPDRSRSRSRSRSTLAACYGLGLCTLGCGVQDLCMNWDSGGQGAICTAARDTRIHHGVGRGPAFRAYTPGFPGSSGACTLNKRGRSRCWFLCWHVRLSVLWS